MILRIITRIRQIPWCTVVVPLAAAEQQMRRESANLCSLIAGGTATILISTLSSTRSREKGGFRSAFRPLFLGPSLRVSILLCVVRMVRRPWPAKVYRMSPRMHLGGTMDQMRPVGEATRYRVVGLHRGPCLVAVWRGGLVREKKPLFRLLPRDRKGSLGSPSRAPPARGGTAGCGQLATWGAKRWRLGASCGSVGRGRYCVRCPEQWTPRLFPVWDVGAGGRCASGGVSAARAGPGVGAGEGLAI